MKKLLGFLTKLFTITLLVSITAAVALYAEGYYDISFIKRGGDKNTGAPDASGVSDNEIVSDYTDADFDDGNADPSRPSDNTAPSGTPGQNQGETAALSEKNPSAPAEITAENYSYPSASSLYASGYKLDVTKYNPSAHRIAEVKVSDVALPKNYSHREEKVTTQVYDDSKAVWNTEESTRVRPVLEPYMGFIIYDDGTNHSLMDSDGRLLMTKFQGYSPAYMRDEYQRPLFRRAKQLYYVDRATRSLVPSGYNEAFAPGLLFDSPSGYGDANNNLYLYYVDTTEVYVANTKKIAYAEHYGRQVPEPLIVEEPVRLYGYMYASGEVAIDAQYHYAFNFSDNGLAVVGNRDRQLWLINKSGRTIINVNSNILYPEERNRRPTYDGYYMPVTNGPEQMGMFYFDNGLMRVRQLYTDYYDLEPVISEDLLISSNGTRFNIPAGYRLVWYSDGILTLKKDEYYGCMNTSGRWIAQPVYTYAGPFSEGLCVLGYAGGMKGMIDTEGNEIIPFIYDKISEVSSGVITVWREGYGWKLLNKLA